MAGACADAAFAGWERERASNLLDFATVVGAKVGFGLWVRLVAHRNLVTRWCLAGVGTTSNRFAQVLPVGLVRSWADALRDRADVGTVEFVAGLGAATPVLAVVALVRLLATGAVDATVAGFGLVVAC